MKGSLGDWVDRARPRAGEQAIVCECSSATPADGTRWLWVFEERGARRLKQRWAGVLTRAEIDERLGRLREVSSFWLGGIDSRHAPPARWFRLVWTLPPAPCRIYTRRGLAVTVKPGVATRHLSGRRRAQLAVSGASVLEGWISRDWKHAGISLLDPEGEPREVMRLLNAGLFTQFLVMYDGIDLMVDTTWLDCVVPRAAEALGVPWRIVDYTETPEKVTGRSDSDRTGSGPGGVEP